MPARTSAGRDDEHDRDQPQLPERPRLDPVVGTVDGLHHGPSRRWPPRARRRAPSAKAIAEPLLFCAASFLRASIMIGDAVRRDRADEALERVEGAGPKSPSRPISEDHVGKNASSELKATCCARPMQSSAMNSLPVRLKTSSHSRQDSCSGLGGRLAAPVLVAVDKGERAEACLRRCPPGCGASAGASSRRSRRRRRSRARVRGRRRAACPSASRSRPSRAQVVGGDGEVLALGLDVAADLLGVRLLAGGHRASAPPS